MLLVSSLHIHEADDVREMGCVECVHHQCHGHLTQLSDVMHECVLCQFLTITCVAVAAWTLICLQPKRKIVYALYRQATCLTLQGNIKLRAPPSV